MSLRKCLVLFLGGALLIGALMACGSASSANTGTAVNTPSGNTPAPTAQHFKVGQAVNVGDTWQMMVNSAKTSAGGQYSALKSGDVYLIFSITAKNVSSQEQNISSALSFNLQDSTGQKYNETIDPDSGATLDGKVEAGSRSKGVVVYEVPKSVKSFQLAFEANIISSGQTIWDITV